ncbi:reverse transcriptase domain-containing protein [Tanacetum coccineum]
MAKVDEEKTSFITSQGIFCYSKMPFGLKNAGATYQRLVDKAFQKQIGRNLEAYVDDLVIKSCTEQEVIRDVEETFKTLRKINMKLNPKKCTFGMKEGVFLSYKVNSNRLMVCPDKVEAVLSLPSPKCLKDVQILNGKLASLNRFLSKSAERSLPFFKTLKKCTKKSVTRRQGGNARRKEEWISSQHMILGALTDEAVRNRSIKKNPKKKGNGGEPSMDWLSNHKAEIICHEKVVRIPLPNGKVHIVLGERPEEKARFFMGAKAGDMKQEEIVVVRDFPEIRNKDSWSADPMMGKFLFNPLVTLELKHLLKVTSRSTKT